MEIKSYKKHVEEEFIKFKIYEAFLESGPQAILQLWIFFFYAQSGSGGGGDKDDKTDIKNFILTATSPIKEKFFGPKSEITDIQVLQGVNIITSFTSLMLSAGRVYLHFPMKVCINYSTLYTIA